MSRRGATGRKYHIKGVLGRGGFGTVYRADLTGPGGFARQVALKVLNRDVAANADLASRLRDEARVLGMISHRAIVQVDGLAVLDDRWAVVMELVEGSDLQRIIELGPVPVGAALEIVAEVAGGLHVAHNAIGPDGTPLALLHRDLKPTNILLTPHGEIKVVDFGVARGNFRGREARTRDVTFGSPGYVAPERMDLQELPAGDVYALGVLLYELLTGERFGRSNLRPQEHQAVVDAAVGAANRRGLAADVVGLMAEMVAYEPNRRPSARDVERRARDLRSEVDGPWLRDWAEDALGRLPPRTEDETHDFSQSVLMERQADPGATIDPASYESQPPKFYSQEFDLPADPSAATLLRTPTPPPAVQRPAPREGQSWIVVWVGIVMVVIPSGLVMGAALVAGLWWALAG